MQPDCRKPSRVSHRAVRHLIRITSLPTLLEDVFLRHLFCRLDVYGLIVRCGRTHKTHRQTPTRGLTGGADGWLNMSALSYLLEVGSLLAAPVLRDAPCRITRGFWLSRPACLYFYCEWVHFPYGSGWLNSFTI